MFGLRTRDRALVIGAHPDDETLGMAGTIATLTAFGVRVDVLSITCTTTPMYGGSSDSDTRLGEFSDACNVLGVKDRRVAWVDDHCAADPGAHLPALITLIESELSATDPAVLFLPAGGHHQDHQAVHRAAMAAVRPGPRGGRPLPRLILGYDGPEDQAWLTADARRPVLVDITDAVQIKTKALSCYASQLRPAPHPRSLEKIAALDQAAGAALGAGAAERFTLYRMAS